MIAVSLQPVCMPRACNISSLQLCKVCLNELQRFRELTHYRGEADPFKGDVLNQKVRDAAKETLDAIFQATDTNYSTSSAKPTLTVSTDSCHVMLAHAVQLCTYSALLLIVCCLSAPIQLHCPSSQVRSHWRSGDKKD